MSWRGYRRRHDRWSTHPHHRLWRLRAQGDGARRRRLHAHGAGAGPDAVPTPPRPDLVAAWAGFDMATAVGDGLGKPARVVNDAELAGMGVIEGAGFEVVLTLGTGLGCALFDD